MAALSEDDKNLLELQNRLLESSQTLSRLAMQERNRMMQLKRNDLMVTELKVMPDDVKTYRGVGKAYFLASKPQVMEETEAATASLTKEMQSLKVQRGIVQQKAKETEAEYKELLQGLQGTTKQFAGIST